jgi:hypothetical protein
VSAATEGSECGSVATYMGRRSERRQLDPETTTSGRNSGRGAAYPSRKAAAT